MYGISSLCRLLVQLVMDLERALWKVECMASARCACLLV